MAQVEFNVPGPGTYLVEADPSLPPLAQPGTAADVLTGEQFYDEEGNPITGTMPNNPAESVVIPGGGSYTIPQGYHTGQGTVTSSGSVLPTLTDPASAGEIVSGKEVIDQNGSVLTGTMPSQGAQVITPGTTQQTINGGVYLTGTQTIQGDAGLVPENIKSGITIFGVTGEYAGEQTLFAVPLTITVDSGVTVSAINGDTTLTAASNGTAQFILPKGGTWTITATKDGETAVTTVTVQESYTGELEFIVGEVVYYGTASNIMAAYDIAGTNVGDYAIFAGGEPDGNHTYDALSTVYAFNSSLTRSTADSLPYNQKQSLGANFAGHALIIGGKAYRSSTTINPHEIVSYDISLTRTLLESIHQSYIHGAQASSIFLISGSSSSGIDAYLDELLTFHEIESIRLSSIAGGIDIGAYALFHNGLEVIAIDSSLTQQDLADLTIQRNYSGVAQNGVYALIAGGYYSSTSYNTVEAYDYSLTQTIAPSLTSVGSRLTGGRLGDFAVFSCCYPSSTNYTDVYDTSLTRESKDPLSSQRFYTAVANTGNYLLYGGGQNRSYDYFATVDVYQLNITT